MHIGMPIRPSKIYKNDTDVIAPMEQENDELELEAELASKSKNIDEIDKKLKEIEKMRENLKGDDEDYECVECETLKKLPVIKGPTEKEREEHKRYHIPYRSWCEICVQAKKKNVPHYTIKEKRTCPVISMDYMYASDKNAILVLKDGNFGGVWALMVIRKGNGGEYAAVRVADILQKIGYARCILKCDQEPAIVDVSKEVRRVLWQELKDIAKITKDKHVGEIVVMDDETPIEILQEHSPVGESSSNGMVERAIQEVSGQMRALKLNIEAETKSEMTADHPIWPWLVEYAAMSLYLYQVGSDGKTARQRTRGRGAMVGTVALGEQVLYKPMKTVKIGKTQARWNRGTWLGIIDHTNEHIIGTEDGVVKCRAIQPRDPENRWDIDAMLKIKGTPWKPNPNRNSLRIPTSINREESEGEEEQDPDKAPEDIGGDFEVQIDEKEDAERQREEVKRAKAREAFETRFPSSRKMCVMKEDVFKYGLTPGCKGCKSAIGEIKSTAGHNAECRERIMQAMAADPIDCTRVEREEKRQEKKEEEEKEKSWAPGWKNAKRLKTKGMEDQTAEPPNTVGASSSNAGMKRGIESTSCEDAKKSRPSEETGTKRKSQEEGKESEKKRKDGDECMNLCTRNGTGEVWDFSRLEHRNEAARKVIAGKPTFILGDGIHGKMGEYSNKKGVFERCAAHLDFLGKLYAFQEREDKYYMHLIRHGEKDSTWTHGVKGEKNIRSMRTHSQQCFIESTADMRHVEESRVKIMTNSACVVEQLTATNAKAITRGNIKEFKDFPGSVVLRKNVKDAMNKGIQNQKESDEVDAYIIGAINQVSIEEVREAEKSAQTCHDEKENDIFDENFIAVDDVSGKNLVPSLVKRARRDEIDYIKKLGVYKKVPKSKCHGITGKKPIQVRWIDVNKGDDTNTHYRSRLVAKDFKTFVNLEWYAATPPLEVLRALISMGATTTCAAEGPNKIMINDISRAYFYAPSTEPTFVELCEEDKEEGDENMCGELLVSMYGTRPAATNWQKCYTDLLEANGFRKAKSNSCLFCHKDRRLKTMVHGDDFVTAGSERQLTWFKGILESKFETKSKIIGPERHDDKSAKVLNRIISYTEYGIEYEADQRHAEAIIKDMNMQVAKPLATAGSDEPDYSETKDALLNEHYATIYRSVVAKCNYLAADRPDIQYATKECAKGMSSPTEEYWSKLKRLARYLKGKPRVVFMYEWQEPTAKTVVFSDANWAGDRQTRKSTSGGCIMLGKHWVKSWSKSQSTIALSSAESELYACIKASSEGLGFLSIMKDYDMTMRGEIRSDASAALGVIARNGLGKLRHVDTSYLWIQQTSAEKKLKYGKVDGKDNIADIMTKNVPKELSEKHCFSIGMTFKDGRHELAPELKT